MAPSGHCLVCAHLLFCAWFLFEIPVGTHAGSARPRICPEKNGEIWQERSTGQVAACATLPYSDADPLSGTREQRLAPWTDREYQPLRSSVSCHLPLVVRYASGDEFHASDDRLGRAGRPGHLPGTHRAHGAALACTDLTRFPAQGGSKY